MRPGSGEEEAAAAEVVSSGWVAQGPRVAEFERAFAATVGAAHAVAVSSCTTALHLALVAAGVGPGDEVVVPSFSFIATANAARYVGATPVFADVDAAEPGNLTPETVEPGLTPRTRAVIVVDQAGVPADLDAMQALCDPRGSRSSRTPRAPPALPYDGRPGRRRRRARGLVLPPAQAPHHRRGRDARRRRRATGRPAAPAARARDERQRGRHATPASSR